jgi:hypothetical protein
MTQLHQCRFIKSSLIGAILGPNALPRRWMFAICFSVDRVGTEPEGIAITAKKVFFKIFCAILPARYTFAVTPIFNHHDAPFASPSIALRLRNFAAAR